MTQARNIYDVVRKFLQRKHDLKEVDDDKYPKHSQFPPESFAQRWLVPSLDV